MSMREGPLSTCVKSALERYFRHLDGEPTRGLYDMVLSQIERPLLEIVMNHTGSNQSKAAEMLGINRNTLRKKLKTYGLNGRAPRRKAARKK